ncbi:MAG: hypothetical protein Q9192_007569, partial [Flavoplaca navasiana]
MSNGENYVLDLTAAQYGWHGPAIIPCSIFERERMDTILETCELGETAKGLASQLQELGSDQLHHYWATEFMRNCFNDALAEWQQVNVPLTALLRASEGKYREGSTLLLGFMRLCMNEIKAEVNERSAAT